MPFPTLTFLKPKYNKETREVKEEIGYTPKEEELKFIGTQYQNMTAENHYVENEFCWLYLLKLEKSIDLILQDSEVASLRWELLDSIKQELSKSPNSYVPHSNIYFRSVFEAMELVG